MGESFSAQLSTGIATFSVPFSLLPARGGRSPRWDFLIPRAGGFGLAGVGWDVGVPFIARQTDRGLPNYADQVGADFYANQDRFVFNGGQELVPICVVTGGACAGAAERGHAPRGAKARRAFRPRVEGSFLRFFWSPDHKTWRVQDKSGVTMELGVPLDGSNDTSALDVNPSARSRFYSPVFPCASTTRRVPRIHPRRAAGPAPNNVVLYRYLQDGGMAYPSDIYDTTPAVVPATTNTCSLFAHHTHLRCTSSAAIRHVSFRSGWRMDQSLRLIARGRCEQDIQRCDSSLRAPPSAALPPRLIEAGQHASLLDERTSGRNAARAMKRPLRPKARAPRMLVLLRTGPPSCSRTALAATSCPR